ncbi:MAG: hypothetical protein CPSOU_6764 [uncultured Paraburkholderia sp.]|nr:MAG: hypothetical protein CPSOU_6764 [uncultured Paraburkholderia sp.]
MVGQQVQLRRDQYGAVTWAVDANYPRRARPLNNPYPDSLPATSWDSSYDDQQNELIRTEQRSQPLHLDDPQAWRLGLPCQQRANVLTGDASQIPGGGLSFEALTQDGGLLDAGDLRHIRGPATDRLYG